MIFLCKLCNYETYIHSNYKKHILTQKHLEKSKDNVKAPRNPPVNLHKFEVISENFEKKDICQGKIKCQYCETYIDLRHFRRHLRRCFEREKIINIITEKDKIIKDKEKIVKEKDENLKEKDRQIYMLAQKVKGNSYTYILNCFANKAPALEKFSNFALIQSTKHNEKFSVAEIAIHYFQRKDLHKYLGDILISIYKKKKPTEQSLWATDVSRLVYIVREKVKKKNVWRQDKGGIKTKFCIIQPILDHVYKKLDEYIRQKVDCNQPDAMQKIKNATIALDIQRVISDHTMETYIIKYIANSLALDKKLFLTE